MKYLLPHRFKKISAIMAPLGVVLWLAMQWGYVNRLLTYLFGEKPISEYEWSAYHITNIIVAALGFFSFLAGLYFIAFSKKKVEDEMVQSTRLQSFQFAALLQIIVTIAGFLVLIFVRDTGESGLMLFFITLLLLFWVSFIARFNYILHFKYK